MKELEVIDWIENIKDRMTCNIISFESIFMQEGLEFIHSKFSMTF